MAQLVERLLCKQDVAGSNPATSTSVWVSEAPPVSGGDARGASPFAFCSWQLAVGSWQCEFAIHDFRLAIASGHSGICGFAVATTPPSSCVAREWTDSGKAVGRCDGEGAIATCHGNCVKSRLQVSTLFLMIG